jgi:hypothetical protein
MYNHGCGNPKRINACFLEFLLKKGLENAKKYDKPRSFSKGVK